MRSQGSEIPAAVDRRLRLAALLTLAIVLGLLSRWKVFEYDLFWQVRAGREILQTGQVQRVDSWSFTARGQTWLNFQWLSTVVEALVAKLAAGYAAFGWFRAGLVAVWSGLLLRLCMRGPGGAVARVLACAILAPWAYLICSFRLQMRPDLFAACLFAALLTLLDARLAFRRKATVGVALLIVWANFHSGTAPFGILVFGSFLLIAERKRAPLTARAPWTAAGALAWFCNPLGWRVLEVIWKNVITYDDAATGNPDFQPFTWKLLEFHEGGWALRLWVAFAIVIFPAYLWVRRRRAEALPEIWRDRAWVLITGAALTGLTLNKIRAVHYMVAFLLPVAGAALATAFSLAGRRTRASWKMAGWAAVPLALFWGWMIPDQVAYIGKPLGAGVLETELPVRSVEFLRTIQVEPNLLNSYRFGGYLIAELPSLPVAIDGRALPFLDFGAAEAAARADTSTYAAFLDRWNINVVLQTIPGTMYHPQAGFLDASRLLLPASEWALVFFDNCSVVYLRRIPAQAEAIRRYEYHYLQRGLPSNYGAEMKGVPEMTRMGIRLEARRCVREQPWNVYCHAVSASYSLADGRPEEALAELQRAERIDPRSAEILVELQDVYGKLGRSGEARAAKARFDRVATALQ